MKAIVRTEYGGTERMRLVDQPEPSPGRGEVLVDVHAAGLDRGVWHLMTGEPWLARLAFGIRRPRQPILGRDLAGVVAALGEGVDGLGVGDTVVGTSAGGTFAEQAVARADRLVRIPHASDLVAAASVPVSGITALQAVRDHGRVREGQRVLVIGASGGVGSFVVQLARHAGAVVDGVCSAAKAEFVQSLGVDRVYAHDAGGEPPRGAYDVVIECGSTAPLRSLRRLLTRRGTLVLVGGESSGRLLAGFDRALRSPLYSLLVPQRLTFFLAGEEASELSTLMDLVSQGALVPAVERTWPLADAAAAMDHLDAGRARGKVVVSVRG